MAFSNLYLLLLIIQPGAPDLVNNLLVKFVLTLQQQIYTSSRSSCVNFDLIFYYEENAGCEIDLLFKISNNLVTSAKLTNETLSYVSISPVHKYDQPCPIVITRIKNPQNITAEHWYEYLPEIHLQGYFVFLFYEPIHENELLEFAKSTPLFLRVFLAVSSKNSLDIHTRGVLIRALDKVTTFEHNEPLDKNHALILSGKYTDYNGAPLIAMVSPVGARAVTEFEETGNWIEWSSPVIYELARVFNATLELATVYTLPREGKNKEGLWDDYTAPLLDGSSAISSTITPSVENNQVVLLTRSTHNELVVFVTARPKKITVSSLLQLLRPLNTHVWAGIIVSIFLIVSTVEFMIHLQRKRILRQRIKKMFRNPRREALFKELLIAEEGVPKYVRNSTLYAVLQPIIDQPGITSKILRTNLAGFWIRFVIGSWFLMLIVLMCAYKSKLIERIVLPYYSQPPTTFLELAESEYGIGVVFWTGVVEDSFRALNNSMSRSILERAFEHNFFDEDCYVSIFDGENACIGFRGLFNRIGMRYMVDVNKQKMFVSSKQVLFPVFTSMGLSRYYPELNEPFNQIISSFEAADLAEMWNWYSQLRALKKGKIHAEDNLDEKPFYSGNENKNAGHYQRSKLLASLVAAGNFLASVIFLLEFMFRFWQNRRVPDNLLPFLF